ncbi:MAG: GntR family transcriptional regulator [Janthinobacterium lividum]
MSALPRFTLDRTRYAAPQVLGKLREAILSLELPPGAVLTRLELADRFGVSQTPVREALLRLQEEGLVDVFPQHATLVSRISITAAREAHFLRRALELELVEQLARETPAGLVDAMKATIALQASLADAQRYGEFVDADRAFHRQMYEAGGVPALWSQVMKASGHVDRLRRLHLPTAGKTESILRDHRAIVQGIEARDPAAARSALRGHLSGTLSAVDTICDQYPDFIAR